MISAKEMFEAIANRVRAPIVANIIFFSVALNWDNFLIFFFADNPIEDRIASLKSDFNFLTYLIAPTLLGVIWTFVFGHIYLGLQFG